MPHLHGELIAFMHNSHIIDGYINLSNYLRHMQLSFDNLSIVSVSESFALCIFKIVHFTMTEESGYGTINPVDSLSCEEEIPRRTGIVDKGLSWIKEKNMMFKSTTEDISWTPYIMLCIFFTSHGMTIHSIMAEMPVLVQHTPEGQNLPAYTTIMSSCAFIAPLCYILCMKCVKWRPKRCVVPLMLMLTLGLLQILMAFTWDMTSTISGSQHSILLLIWAMLGIMTDALGIAQYPVFMEGFKSQYVSSIYVGDSTGGLLTACIGMIQGVGDNECVNVTLSTNLTHVNTYKVIPVSSPPLFTVTTFYIAMFSITCTCITAFIWINFSTNFSLKNASSDALDCPIIDIDNTHMKNEVIPALSRNDSTIISEKHTMYFSSNFQRYTLFILIVINYSLFKLYHSAILQYACQSYTNDTYSLATRSSFIVRSLATPCALLLRVRSLVIMVLITALGLVMEAYIICVGVMSPDPPLKGTDTGSSLMVRLAVIL